MGFISKILKNPIQSLFYLLAIARGSVYIIRYRILNNKVRIKFPFAAFAPVRITGPGSVSIGKGNHVQKSIFRGLTIVTLSPNALVTIGEKCLLGGVTIRCRQRVEVGDGVMMANPLIQDSFFANPEYAISRIEKNLINETRPITIGTNAWLGAESIILGGTKIGNDTVLSAGAWCLGTYTGDYMLVSGNPAKKPLPIDKLLRLKGIA